MTSSASVLSGPADVAAGDVNIVADVAVVADAADGVADEFADAAADAGDAVTSSHDAAPNVVVAAAAPVTSHDAAVVAVTSRVGVAIALVTSRVGVAVGEVTSRVGVAASRDVEAVQAVVFEETTGAQSMTLVADSLTLKAQPHLKTLVRRDVDDAATKSRCVLNDATMKLFLFLKTELNTWVPFFPIVHFNKGL